jgi:heat shock protein HtpX
MNLFEQQVSNIRRTWVVMLLFIIFVGLLGLGFDYFYLGSFIGLSAGNVPTPVGLLLALGVASFSAFGGYMRGDKAVLASTGAVPLSLAQATASEEQRLKLRQLENVVEEMSIAAGLPLPAVYVLRDPDPNAFATGRDPEHASIAVTEGLLAALDRDELQGVVGHEMAHIRNLDIRLKTLVAALVGAVVLLSDWAARGMRYGAVRGRGAARGRKGEGGGAGVLFFVVWIVAVILAPLIAQVLAMTVSRAREYLADASAAQLTRNPAALARALEKIEMAVEPTASIRRGSAHLCIADPLGRRIDQREGLLADLFATHPPMHKRIAALRQMAFLS